MSPLVWSLLVLTCAAVEETADSLLSEAQTQMASAQFSQALERLEKAATLHPSPSTLAQINYARGTIKEMRGSLSEALKHFYAAWSNGGELDLTNTRERARKLLLCAREWSLSKTEAQVALEAFDTFAGVAQAECPPLPETALPENATQLEEPPAVGETVETKLVPELAEAPSEPAPRSLTPVWIAGALVVSSSLVGGLTWHHASNRANAANEAAARYDREGYDEAKGSAERAGAVSKGAVGVAVLAALAAGALWLWPDSL